jgi:CarD family transcriptional regulator
MSSKKTVQRQGFKTSESVVYPSHGVGKIVDIEEQEVAGIKMELFVIHFEKDKMTLKVPVVKAESVGMRKLADEKIVAKAIETVKGRARVKRTMWSRRAQEYEAKINSGDLISISEVVRDLYRSDDQPEPSYSERQLYEAAIDRMSREVASVEKTAEGEAVTKIEGAIESSPKRKRAAQAAADDAQVEAA